MKFEIDIPEDIIQKFIEERVNPFARGRLPPFQDIIGGCVDQAIIAQLQADVKKSFDSRIEELIDREIAKAVEQKVPGWVKRRVKEMLEGARKLQ